MPKFPNSFKSELFVLYNKDLIKSLQASDQEKRIILNSFQPVRYHWKHVGESFGLFFQKGDRSDFEKLLELFLIVHGLLESGVH